MNAREVNFDGLVGLTHHYAGLSFGNEASTKHRFQVSNPKLAAKQGLLKMKALADMGYPQGIIPPQERPNIGLLRQLGFDGTDQQVVEKAWKLAPDLLSAACSASSMWVANAATVCPSADALDGRVHLTVANLNNKLHRASEAVTTERVLKAILITASLAFSCLFMAAMPLVARRPSAIRRARRCKPPRPWRVSTRSNRNSWYSPSKIRRSLTRACFIMM